MADRRTRLEPITATGTWVGVGAPEQPRLVAFWESYMVTRELVAGATLTIGRAPDCDICIDHKSVSRRHARVIVEDPLRVEDLGSANGTRVGAIRLAARQSAPFVVGQIVSIGAATLFVQPGGMARGAFRGCSGGGEQSGLWPEGGAMGRVARVLELVAVGDISVLLLGETGVGKELAAEAIHRRSPRAALPFVRINCAALPEQLLESELFGYERGAFTGADRSKPGLIESADGGSVFLDEIGELSPPTQAKLLRVLESREVTRLGALASRRVDVRWITATNRDLGALVAQGAFRQDLFYRINGIPVRIPPLRDRVEEIAPLSQRFVREIADRIGCPPPVLTRAALDVLEKHAFPGNVRELRNLIERAVLLAQGRPIAPEHFALDDRIPDPASPQAPEPGALDLRKAVEQFERARIIEALERTDGNQTRAAELLGISRRSFVAKLAEYGIGRRGRGGSGE